MLAYYTYENIGYGDVGIGAMQSDLDRWNDEVVPILGQVDMLVYAQGSDIADGWTYSGDKYELLKSKGFSYFIGFCEGGNGWFYSDVGYVRQGRMLVSGSTLAHNSDWFADLFYASNILDSGRGNVPE